MKRQGRTAGSEPRKGKGTKTEKPPAKAKAPRGKAKVKEPAPAKAPRATKKKKGEQAPPPPPPEPPTPAAPGVAQPVEEQRQAAQQQGRPVTLRLQRLELAGMPQAERAALLEQLPPEQREHLLTIPPDEADAILEVRPRKDLPEFTFAVPRVLDAPKGQRPLIAHVDRLPDLADCRFIYTQMQEGVRVVLNDGEKRMLLERAAAHRHTVVKLTAKKLELKKQLQELDKDIADQERHGAQALDGFTLGYEMRDCRTRYYLTPERMVLEAVEVREGEVELARPRFPTVDEDSKIERASRGPLFKEAHLQGARKEGAAQEPAAAAAPASADPPAGAAPASGDPPAPAAPPEQASVDGAAPADVDGAAPELLQEQPSEGAPAAPVQAPADDAPAGQQEAQQGLLEQLQGRRGALRSVPQLPEPPPIGEEHAPPPDAEGDDELKRAL